MSRDNRLLELAAMILLNMKTGAYTTCQNEDAGKILEVIIRRHYSEGGCE
jgi:hypothetical protein